MSKIVSLYECDKCKTLIRHPTDGIVIHGNIYVADPENQGGLIGNNFPTEPIINRSTESISDSVGETVMCVGCFISAVFPDHKFTVTRGRAIE